MRPHLAQWLSNIIRVPSALHTPEFSRNPLSPSAVHSWSQLGLALFPLGESVNAYRSRGQKGTPCCWVAQMDFSQFAESQTERTLAGQSAVRTRQHCSMRHH